MIMDNTISTILTGVLIPILPIITAYLVALLKKKVSEIEGKAKNENVDKYMGIVENVIETCVAAVSQTYVDALKQDGKFDDAAQSEAFETCKQKILSILSNNIKATLTDAYGDLNAFIDAKIEYYVKTSNTK